MAKKTTKKEKTYEIAYLAVKPKVKKAFEALRAKENAARKLPANGALSQSEFEALLLRAWKLATA